VLTSSKKCKGQGEGAGRQSSQHRGVSWNKQKKKWNVQIKYDGKRQHLGCFEDEQEAARVYDKAARAHKGEKAKLNCPTKKEQAAEEAKQQRWIKCGEAGSKYRGVSWYKRDSKWKAQIECDGKNHHLGSFEDEKEAAKAYDRAARTHHGETAQLNLPHKRPRALGVAARDAAKKSKSKSSKSKNSGENLEATGTFETIEESKCYICKCDGPEYTSSNHKSFRRQAPPVPVCGTECEAAYLAERGFTHFTNTGRGEQ
jgi:hypothetical protein